MEHVCFDCGGEFDLFAVLQPDEDDDELYACPYCNSLNWDVNNDLD